MWTIYHVTPTNAMQCNLDCHTIMHSNEEERRKRKKKKEKEKKT
jgi:hypothetical protein